MTTPRNTDSPGIGWTEWERPWTRAEGVIKGYGPMSGPPQPGQVVALRSPVRPYLPTFAPWWHGLIVDLVSDEVVSFVNAPKLLAEFDRYPIETHWAQKEASDG